MTRLFRYEDLVEMGVVRNRMAPRRLAESQGFPLPIKLGSNSVAWPADEVEAWLAARPRVTLPEKEAADARAA